MFKKLRYDIKSVKERDPAARSGIEVFFLYPGIHAVSWYRIAHFFYKHKRFFIARAISQTSRFFTGIEIHPGAIIGKGLLIDHGGGVVIGETAEIGDDCTIYQGVTLGGTGKETGKRHPTLGNHVMVGSGAKVLGPFKVGDYARIAANAVVLEKVPPYSTAVGVPAKIVKVKGKRTDKSINLDQIHIPDPIAKELRVLHKKIDELQQELNKMKEDNK